MNIWGITKKYKGLNWFENFMGGHVTIGRITIYGENAMHWAVNIRTKRWGFICFRLPFRCFGKWHPLYLYVSPNATPWASTFYWGTGRQAKKERIRAKMRRKELGHGFKYQYEDKTWQKLSQINNQYS